MMEYLALLILATMLALIGTLWQDWPPTRLEPHDYEPTEKKL